MTSYKRIYEECVACGRGGKLRILQATGLCSDCTVDATCPTREEIDRQAAEIKQERLKEPPRYEDEQEEWLKTRVPKIYKLSLPR